MREIIKLKGQDEFIVIYGNYHHKKWKYEMEYDESVSTANNWKGVELWLSQFSWKTWSILYVNSNFKDKLEKLKESGDKAHLNAQQRIIDLYKRLQQGEEVNIDELSFDYGLHRESVKDSIYHLRNALSYFDESIDYIQQSKVYKLSNNQNTLQIEDVYILLLFLYESRAFVQAEKNEIEEKLTQSFSLKEKQLLNRFFNTFDYHYQPFGTKSLLPLIKTLIKSIREQHYVFIHYQKGMEEKQRKIKPLSITFHDHAFYLIGQIESEEKDYPSPANFRVDRIKEITVLPDKFKAHDNQSYFSAGDFKKRSFNMFSGENIIVRLKVVKWLEEYTYRTFEQVQRINEYENYVELDVNVLSEEGIIFWILGQQDHVEVISPSSLRKKLKEKISKISKLYQ